MLEIKFTDYDERFTNILFKKKKWSLRKKGDWMTVEEAADAIQLLYNELSKDSSSTRITIEAQHIDEEAKQKSDSSFEVDLNGNDGWSNNLLNLLDDAVNAKPSGADDFDGRMLGIVSGILGQTTATVQDSNNDFPEGADEDEQYDLMPSTDESVTTGDDGIASEQNILQDNAQQVEPELSEEDDEINPDAAFTDDNNDNIFQKFDTTGFGAPAPEQQNNEATSTPTPSATESNARVTSFNEFTAIEMQPVLIRLEREDLLKAMGLDPSAKDELSLRKIGHVLSIYDELKIDEAMKNLQTQAQKNLLSASDELKDIYKEITSLDVSQVAEEQIKERLDDIKEKEGHEAAGDYQDYEDAAKEREDAIEKQKQDKIAALTAQANAEASNEKEQVERETVARREQRKAMLKKNIAAAKERLLADQKELVINARNTDLVTKRNEVMNKYVEENAQLAVAATQKRIALQSEARKEFKSIEETYQAEVSKKEEQDTIKRSTEAQERLADVQEQNNKLAQENQRLQKENTDKFASVAQTNAQSLAMLFPSMVHGQNQDMPGSKQVYELQQSIEKIKEENARLKEEQNKKHKKGWIIGGSVTAVAALGLLIGVGAVAYNQIQSQQEASMAQISAALKDNSTSSTSSSTKQSLTDLLAAGDYDKAAEAYPNVTAIEKITDTIFTSGDASQLQSFVAKHPSAFGKLDEAILAKSQTSIVNQYNALDQQDQQRLSTAQQNAVTAAQKSKGSENDAKK